MKLRFPAAVEGGKITKVVVSEAGSRYSNPPTVTFKGFEKVEVVVTLAFVKDLATNGSVQSIELKK